jgi:hypothetical protein
MLVIPAMQLAEISRIVGSDQSRKNVIRIPSQRKKLGMVSGTCDSSDGRKHKIRGLWFIVLGKCETLFQE